MGILNRPGAWLWLLVASAVSFTSTSAAAQTYRPNNIGITVYTNPNFSGQSATFNNDTPTLVPYGLNDKISSIVVPAGETWEMCQDINYQNRCQTISGSISDLRSMGWNDTISSLRLVRGYQGRRSGGVVSPSYPQGQAYSQGLVIFDRPGFRGASRTITGQTSNPGFGNRGGSVQVQGGPWELCDRTGRCTVVSQDVPDLSRLGLTDQITLARPLNNQRYNNGNGRGYGRGRQDRYYQR